MRAALLVGLLCLVTFFPVYQLWPWQLDSPLHLRGDVLQACRMLKSSALGSSVYQVSQLGAPFAASHIGFPETCVAHLPLLWLLSLVSDNIYWIYNCLFWATFPLVGLSAYVVLRRAGCSVGPATVFAWLYAYLPNHIERYDHFGVACYAAAPWALWLGLGLEAGKPLSWRRAAAAPISAIFGPYPAFFGSLVILWGGLQGSLRQRDWRPLGRGVALCALISATFLAILWPAWPKEAHQAALPYRAPSDLTRWSLSLDHLLLPAHARSLHPLAPLARRYYANFPPPPEPNESPYLGLVALLALAGLGGASLRPYRSWVGWLFLLGMSGGLGQLLTLVVGSSIRCYNRLNYYLAFMLLLGLCLRLSQRSWKGKALVGLSFLGLLGVLEHTLSAPQWNPLLARQQVASDREFVAALERRLTPGSMLWQFPYVAYPESPPAFAEGEYGLGRLWMVSHHLHWSWGNLQGNPGERVQAALARSELSQQVELLSQVGFAGAVVERRGYRDGGRQLEGQLAALGLKQELQSPDGHLSFYPLPASQVVASPGQRLQQLMWQRTWGAGRLEFGRSGWGSLYCRRGWSEPEAEGTWSLGSESWLHLPKLGREDSVRIELEFIPCLPSSGSQSLRVEQDGKLLLAWSGDQPGPVTVEFVAKLPADLRLRYGRPLQPSSMGQADTRPLGIFLRSLRRN